MNDRIKIITVWSVIFAILILEVGCILYAVFKYAVMPVMDYIYGFNIGRVLIMSVIVFIALNLLFSKDKWINRV